MNTINGARVTINDVARDLYAYAADLASYNPAHVADDEGNEGGDVRLQCYEGWWALRTGDIQYDTDHRGAWGCGWIEAGASWSRCREIAAGLIAEAHDCAEDVV